MRRLCLILIFLVSWSTFALSADKVVMIIAHNNFRDEELFETKHVLEDRGLMVTVASSRLGPARGMLGGEIRPDILVSQIDVNDYDAIVFVGGIGASEYWGSPIAHKIAKEAIKKKKVVAAICIAPVTLARAGILKGKKVTSWPSEANKLREEGAIYTGRDVEVDGLIITAIGPRAAKRFAEAISLALGK